MKKNLFKQIASEAVLYLAITTVHAAHAGMTGDPWELLVAGLYGLIAAKCFAKKC